MFWVSRVQALGFRVLGLKDLGLRVSGFGSKGSWVLCLDGLGSGLRWVKGV